MTERELLQHLIETCTDNVYIRGFGWYNQQNDGYMVQLTPDQIKSELLKLHFKDEHTLYKTVNISHKRICAAEKLFAIRQGVDASDVGRFFFLNQETEGRTHFSKVQIPFETQSQIDRCKEWVASVYPQNVRLLQQIGGYILFSPDNRFQKVFLVTGPGANGKGTFLRILTTILEQKVEGEKLATAVDFDDFNVHERVQLIGKQLIYDADISGTPKALRWLKIISGGDKITGRGLYKDPITFLPTCKVLLLSNPIPSWENAPALVRRLVLLQFKQKFTIDPAFEQSLLTDEMLKKWVWYFYEGYQDIQKYGFYLVDENNAGEFLSQADDISHFLQECCIFDSEQMIPTETLYSEFEYFWKEILREKRPCPNCRILGKRLREYGIEKRRNVTLSVEEKTVFKLDQNKDRWDMYKGISLQAYQPGDPEKPITLEKLSPYEREQYSRYKRIFYPETETGRRLQPVLLLQQGDPDEDVF